MTLAAMKRLAALEMDTGVNEVPLGRHVPLTKEAADKFQEWRDKHYKAEFSVIGMLKSSYGKAHGQVLRIALVLEYLWWAAYSSADASEPETISLAAIAAAAGLIEAYFKPMAERVFSESVIPEEERLATALAHYIVKTKPNIINIREVSRTSKVSELRKPGNVERAANALVDANWLYKVDHGGQAHRPSKNYCVNPRLWEELKSHE